MTVSRALTQEVKLPADLPRKGHQGSCQHKQPLLRGRARGEEAWEGPGRGSGVWQSQNPGSDRFRTKASVLSSHGTPCKLQKLRTILICQRALQDEGT